MSDTESKPVSVQVAENPVANTTPAAKPEPTLKQNTPPSVPTPTFRFNETLCLSHITEVKEYLMAFAGQKAHNPFLVITKQIDPLLRRLEDGEKTEELQKAILGLKKEAPVIPGLVKMHETQKQQDDAKLSAISPLPRK